MNKKQTWGSLKAQQFCERGVNSWTHLDEFENSSKFSNYSLQISESGFYHGLVKCRKIQWSRPNAANKLDQHHSQLFLGSGVLHQKRSFAPKNTQEASFSSDCYNPPVVFCAGRFDYPNVIQIILKSQTFTRMMIASASPSFSGATTTTIRQPRLMWLSPSVSFTPTSLPTQLDVVRPVNKTHNAHHEIRYLASLPRIPFHLSQMYSLLRKDCSICLHQVQIRVFVILFKLKPHFIRHFICRTFPVLNISLLCRLLVTVRYNDLTHFSRLWRSETTQLSNCGGQKRRKYLTASPVWGRRREIAVLPEAQPVQRLPNTHQRLVGDQLDTIMSPSSGNPLLQTLVLSFRSLHTFVADNFPQKWKYFLPFIFARMFLSSGSFHSKKAVINEREGTL